MIGPLVTAFLDRLREHRLVTAERLAEAAARPEAAQDDPRPLSNYLIRTGALSLFQADCALDNRVHELTFGTYQLLDRVGGTADVSVFQARHQFLNRLVTLHRLRPDLLTDLAAREKFFRPVRTAGTLSHPHLVSVCDAGVCDGYVFVAEELVEGVDLERLVRLTGALPVAQACVFVQHAALGLQFAWEAGLTHGEIRPACILAVPVLPDPRSGHLSGSESDMYIGRLVGIGLSQALRNLNLPPHGAMNGSAPEIEADPYRAPELAPNATPIDIRTDLYSLGGVLAFLLTGVPPTAGDPPAEVPSELWEIVTRLRAVNPDERFATPAELAIALDRFCRPAGTVVPEAAPVPTASAAPEEAPTAEVPPGAESSPVAEAAPPLAAEAEAVPVAETSPPPPQRTSDSAVSLGQPVGAPQAYATMAPLPRSLVAQLMTSEEGGMPGMPGALHDSEVPLGKPSASPAGVPLAALTSTTMPKPAAPAGPVPVYPFPAYHPPPPASPFASHVPVAQPLSGPLGQYPAATPTAYPYDPYAAYPPTPPPAVPAEPPPEPPPAGRGWMLWFLAGLFLHGSAILLIVAFLLGWIDPQAWKPEPAPKSPRTPPAQQP